MKTLRSFLAITAAILLITHPLSAAKWRVGFSQCNLGEPWRVQMNADVLKAAAAHPELEVVYKDAQNDTLKQRAQIEEFIAAKVDLIIVSPKEAAPLTPPISQAFASGIPVIILDRRTLNDRYTQYIGGDNQAIGTAAGRWINEKLSELPKVKSGGRAKIVELQGLMSSTPAQDRHRGFVATLDSKRAEIIFAVDMKWLEADARKEMESALAVHKEIDVVYAHNDPGAHGAYLAARAAGREKDILFVGIDALPQEGRIYVRQGLLAANFEYPTGGKESIDSALAILHGAKVEKDVILKSRVYTKENVAAGGAPLQ